MAAAVLLVFVFGAMPGSNKENCTGIFITEAGKKVDSSKEKKIFHIVRAYVDKSITEMAAHDIPLNKLEDLLVDEEWIDDASLYIDNTNALHINLNSRKPIARIFDNKGSSYYLDGNGEIFTVFNIKQNNLVLFTGIPVWQEKDSAAREDLLQDLVSIANVVASDSFWMAQTDQIAYTQEGYKLYPALGQHVVWLGNSNDMVNKLDRLKLFYKSVLSQTGLHAFPVINVAYKGQVVVQQQINAGNVSGEQLTKNIEKMIDRNKHIAAETAIESKVSGGRLLDAKPVQIIETKKEKGPAGDKEKESTPQKAEERINKLPKAVMPKRNNNNN